MAKVPGYGVIVFNGQSFTYFVKDQGVELAALKGSIDGDAIKAAVKGYAVDLTRLYPKTDRQPVARGTLRIGRNKIRIVGYRNTGGMGISLDTPPQGGDPCPW